MSFEKPYEDVLVVDLSQGVAGPYCAMLLARHGARVVKVEPPEGDWARILGPRYGDHTAYSVPANLGKESVVLDLKQAAGRAVVERMVAKADVFLEGFRPGVIERLGLGYDRVRALNPSIVYLSVSGFGQRGPLAEKPAMDPVLQAFTGFMSENKGADGIPHRTPTIIVDMSTALYAHQAVAAALYARALDPQRRGRRIEASLMEAAANLQCVRLASAVREGGEFKVAGAPSGTFRTRDGWIQIVAMKDHEFQSVCRALRLGEAADDPRFAAIAGRIAHAAHLNGLVEAVVGAMSSEEARAALTRERVQNEVVQTYEQFARHPQAEALGTVSWLPQPGSDVPWATANPPGLPPLVAGTPEAHAPRKGEHTRGVLASFGYADAEIAALLADGTAMAS
jgi:CoA:oxalate CoA-transferase